MAENWIEWGVRRTWGPAVGSVAPMGRYEAEHAARTWPGELVQRVVTAGDWTTPTAEAKEAE